MKSLVFALVVFISLTTGDAVFCPSPDEDTLYVYPSPNNCSHFVACIDFEEYQLECIHAPMFLEWMVEPICMTPCPAVSTTRRSLTKNSVELPPDPLLYPDTPARTIICPPSGNTTAVVAQSCTEYIDCNVGVGTKMTCPDGEEFSPSRYHCVPKRISDCPKQKLRGSHHIKCRYDKGGEPVYFPSDTCPEFKKCALQRAWDVQCAHYCHWNNELKTCDWADNFDCHLVNE